MVGTGSEPPATGSRLSMKQPSEGWRAGVERLRAKLRTRFRHETAHAFFRRRIVLNPGVPLISFTFDDFPRSALHVGGEILRRSGVAGTYYASLGLMGTQAPAGEMFVRGDVRLLIEAGHELGSHTFDHCDAWLTPPAVFENSVSRNRIALAEISVATHFETMSYPVSPPRPATKRLVDRHFICCRGGGQAGNHGMVDLRLLKAYFVDRGRDDVRKIAELIAENRSRRGWLIFATHDVDRNPTRFGCRPDLFEEIVRRSIESGAVVIPMAKAARRLIGSASDAMA